MQYDYTKEVDVARLTKEIQESSITIALDYISRLGTAVSIFFKASLPEAEEILLDSIVDTHVSTPLAENVPTTVLPKPFADKSDYNFRGTGAKFLNILGSGTTTNLDFSIPANDLGFDFAGMSLFCGEWGDTANLKVLDNANGTYTGTPYAMLNQFAFNFNVKKDECESIMPYAARLYEGMIIRAEYTNNGSAKNIYANYYLHKII